MSTRAGMPARTEATSRVSREHPGPAIKTTPNPTRWGTQAFCSNTLRQSKEETMPAKKSNSLMMSRTEGWRFSHFQSLRSPTSRKPRVFCEKHSNYELRAPHCCLPSWHPGHSPTEAGPQQITSAISAPEGDGMRISALSCFSILRSLKP